MEKPTRLIQSYVIDKWFVSTARRRSSARETPDAYYYETLVWVWGSLTQEREEMVGMRAHGDDPATAMEGHAGCCRELFVHGELAEEG